MKPHFFRFRVLGVSCTPVQAPHKVQDQSVPCVDINEILLRVPIMEQRDQRAQSSFKDLLKGEKWEHQTQRSLWVYSIFK